MFSYFTTFTNNEFKELLAKEDYNNLIYKCYYSYNQKDILEFLEKHLNINNIIINYIYIRNNHKLGKFNDPDVLRKCATIAIKTIFIIVSHINICIEINKNFPVLQLFLKRFDDKFQGVMTLDIFDFAVNQAKKDILNFIDGMTSNINLVNSPTINEIKKRLDLPEPYIICNINGGGWRYPAITYVERTQEENGNLNSKFISNYSARCQKYYEAYQYASDKFNLIRANYVEKQVLSLAFQFE